MLKLKKSLLTLFVVIAILLSSVAFMGFTTNVFAFANGNMYFSNEEYTNSDYLLKPNGTISDKKIQDFSDEVKSASIGTSFPELSQVIPLEFLESTEENATLQHNGKEYGFYVAKDGDYFDVLLIDFIYEFENGEEHSNIEYKIRIKPLLQQTFKRSKNNNGDYVWQKAENNYTYYVANPRFLVTVQNENALNYGDSGYSKVNDEGVIILQNRINYGKISYATESDLVQVTGEVVLDIVVDVFFDTLDKFTLGATSVLSTMYGYTKSGLEGLNQILSVGDEKTVIANNEANITTSNSKTEQRNNSHLNGYSRAVAFKPQEEMILSAADDSYAESIVVLNDSNYKSRLTQICEFDIVRRSDNHSSMEYVAGNWYDEDEQALTFSKQRILFEDQEPQFNITENNIEGEEIPVYLLQNGQQKIVFNPDYSGYYNFETDADVTISVTDSNGNEVVSEQGDFYLRMGRTYTLMLSNSKSEKVISDLSVNLSDRVPDKETSANEKIILRADFGQDDVYSLSTGNSNVLIDDILVGGTNGLESCDNFYGYKASENISLPLSEGEYFIIVQIRENNAEYNISVSGCEEKELGEEVSVAADGKNYVFVKFSGVAEGKYAIASDSSDEVTYRIYDYSLNRVAFSGANNSGSFNISGNIIYVGILADGNTDFKLNPVGVAYEWRIDGKKIDFNAENELEIGKSYEIELYVNGIKQDSSYLESDNEYCTITSDSKEATLKIKGQCDLGVQFKIDYQVGEVRPFDCDLILQTIYTTAFNGFDIVNDEQILLEWVHGKDLVEIDYTMSKPDGSGDIWEQNYCIEPANNAVIGRIYSNDITSQVERINKVLADVTITINEIKVQMPDGLRSFTMDELRLVSEYTVNCFYGDGFGTQGAPYEISCNRHFENMGLNEKQETHFTITKYLELEGNVINDFKGIIANENLVVISWKPKKAYEMGIILNNYGSISNLQVKIKNEFELYEGCTFGGIVCCNQTGGEIKNCSVTYVKTNLFNHWCTAGGISGLNYGKIQGCWAYVDVTTVGIFGAIVGSNRGEISECQGKGTITQKVELFDGNRYMPSYAGGIAGINFEIGSIENCFAGTKYEEINGKLTYDEAYLNIFIVVNNVDDDTLAPYAGPIAGDNRGAISDCSNQGYYIDTGNLHSWWAWFVTYDQLRNINNII